MLFVNKHQIFTFVTTEKTEEKFSLSTAQSTFDTLNDNEFRMNISQNNERQIGINYLTKEVMNIQF